MSTQDPADLITDLRGRINPAYASQLGTESYERRMCADALTALLAERDRLRKSLLAAGFTDCGGELWKPPIPKEATVLVDMLQEAQAERDRLRAELAAAPAAPQVPTLLNGLTEAETEQTASVAGLVAPQVPAECPHLILFDDADRAPLLFAGSGARGYALEAYKRCSAQWNAHLFVCVDSNSRDSRYPIAPHLLSTAPQVPEAVPQWHGPAERLVKWQHCMSYNMSYFGEPDGLIKQCVNELRHLLPPHELKAAAPGATPQPAERVPLTDEQVDTLTQNHWAAIRQNALAAHRAFANPIESHRAFARAIESAHGIKPPNAQAERPARETQEKP